MTVKPILPENRSKVKGLDLSVASIFLLRTLGISNLNCFSLDSIFEDGCFCFGMFRLSKLIMLELFLFIRGVNFSRLFKIKKFN